MLPIQFMSPTKNMKIKAMKIKTDLPNRRILKSAFVLLCVVCFVANSFVIFKQYIGGKTLTSQDVEKNEKLFLPSVTICGLSAFKEQIDEFDDLELENYLNKTLYLEEILVGVMDIHSTLTRLKDMYNNTTHWGITTTYSFNRGRCYTIRYKQEVKKSIKFLCFFHYLRHLILIAKVNIRGTTLEIIITPR